MPNYIKKPCVIKAVKFTKTGFVPWESWAEEAWNKGNVIYEMDGNWLATGFIVKTLEGDMHGNIGDYLIRGVKGELYPCRGDIFLETYQLVEEGGD